MNTIPRQQIVTIIPVEPGTTPESEIKAVADYQQGWNDAQAGRPHKFDASLCYSTGYVDGAYTVGGVQ